VQCAVLCGKSMKRARFLVVAAPSAEIGRSSGSGERVSMGMACAEAHCTEVYRGCGCTCTRTTGTLTEGVACSKYHADGAGGARQVLCSASGRVEETSRLRMRWTR
jgi:hypothetical protein